MRFYRVRVTAYYDPQKHVAVYGLQGKPQKGDRWYNLASNGEPKLFDLEYDACAYAAALREPV